MTGISGASLNTGYPVSGRGTSRMVSNLRRHRRLTADTKGQIWSVGSYRKDTRFATNYQVFFNGRDVTHSCFYFDTRRGRVRLFVRDSEGKFYIGRDGNIAETEKRGHVKVKRIKGR